MHPLTGPRQKLKRAEEQIGALNAKVMTFFQNNRHEVFVAERELGTDYYALRVRVPSEPPADWGVTIGEIAHNLRSTLDSLVWQSTILNGIDPDTLKRPLPEFPIFLVETLPKGACYTRDGVPRIHLRVMPAHEKVIESEQPYKPGNKDADSPLWLLQELNNADKHRLLPVAASTSSKTFSDFMFRVPPRTMSTDEYRKHVLFDQERFFVDGAKVGRIHRIAAESEPDVELLPIMQMVFAGGCKAVEGRDLTRTLNDMGRYVAHITWVRFSPAFRPLPNDWA